MIAWFRAIGGALGLVPKWVWYLLLAAIAWHFALAWHAGKVKAHDQAVIAARDAQWQKRFEQVRKQADDVRQKAEALGRNISSTLKGQHDAQVRSNASVARDMQLRGPGKAAAPSGCRPGDHPGVPAAAGGPQRPAGAGDAPTIELHPADRLSGLPAGARNDFAIIPWSWLTDQGRQSDDTRDEALKWRAWYVSQWTAWERMRGAKPPRQ